MTTGVQPHKRPQAVTLATLAAGELILVDTGTSRYRVALTDPQAGGARIDGGSAFPEPVEVRVVGAASGTGFLRPGTINVGLGMGILTGDHYLVTSAVRSIRLPHKAGRRRRPPPAVLGAEPQPKGSSPTPVKVTERPRPSECCGVL